MTVLDMRCRTSSRAIDTPARIVEVNDVPWPDRDPRMKNHAAWVPALAALLSVSAPAREQASAADIMALERSWMTAMQHRDAARLEALLAPDFTLAGAAEMSRKPIPRAEWLSNALHHLRVDAFAFGASRTHILGDVAQVQAEFRWRGAFHREAFTDKVIVLDTWQRTDAGWRVTSRLIATPPASK